MSKDFVGDVFRRAEAAGEWVRFPVWSRSAPGEAWKLAEHSHAEHDAIGAILKILRERGLEPGRVPENREKSAPSILSRLRLSLGDPRVPITWKVDWRRFDRSWAATKPESARPTARAWKVLSLDKTRELDRAAKSAGVSLNTYLLWTLNRSIVPELVGARRMGFDLWMMPVNLRGPVRLSRDTMNHASYVGLRVGEDLSPSDLHQEIRARLAAREHWRAWYSAGMLGALPRGWVDRGVRDYYRRKGHAWTGVFSNAGEWNVAGSPELEIAFAPPPTKAQPFCAAAVRVNGKLSVAIQAHPALSRDEMDAKLWLERWITSALS